MKEKLCKYMSGNKPKIMPIIDRVVVILSAILALIVFNHFEQLVDKQKVEIAELQAINVELNATNEAVITLNKSQEQSIKSMQQNIGIMQELIVSQSEQIHALLEEINGLRNPAYHVEGTDNPLDGFYLDMNFDVTNVVEQGTPATFDKYQAFTLYIEEGILVLENQPNKVICQDGAKVFSIYPKEQITEKCAQIVDTLYFYTTDTKFVAIYQIASNLNLYLEFPLDDEWELTDYFQYMVDLWQQRIVISIG